MPRGFRIRGRILFALLLGSVVGVAAWRLRQGMRTPTQQGASARTEAATPSRAAAPFVVGEAIYDGGLRPGWDDKKSGLRGFVAGAPARVHFDGFQSLTLYHEPLPAKFETLVFRFKAGATFG